MPSITFDLADLKKLEFRSFLSQLLNDVPASDVKVAPVVENVEFNDPVEEEPVVDNEAMTFTEFKNTVDTIKKKHGLDFVTEVLESFDITVGKQLGRTLSKIPAEIYADIWEVLHAGPKTPASLFDDDDEDDFDDLNFEDEQEEPKNVTAAEIRALLLKATKKKGNGEIKALLKSFKIKSLVEVNDLDQKTLNALGKALNG